MPMIRRIQEITTLPSQTIICDVRYTASTPQRSPSARCILWAAQSFRSSFWRRRHYGKLIGA
ncbi:hypothetical protein K443DRAFT_617871 [Laccaria amethystina LaAM-08-1]|uniref:Uncharacterized protein n=1 Tax=Laccaria amethystina LaAM-08-1 TaxID=1095629 RepID=A0A0C9WZ34_9AGAR|nr:hypothetical protein K443DRAFT_617871 [Laccaria amethystina LaAM-08-1]